MLLIYDQVVHSFQKHPSEFDAEIIQGVEKTISIEELLSYLTKGEIIGF